MPHAPICIAIAGAVENGKIISLPNIKNGNARGFAKRLRKLLRSKVFIENDVKCAALAESEFGKARGASLALLVWPGSGIGGAIISNGKIIRGAHNSAGEFGHVKIDFSKNARKCGCGARGCFEAYCGGRGIENAYFEKFKKRKSAKEIFSSSKSSDVKFAKSAAHLFGFSLASLANAFNPDIIIVGGSLSNAYLGRYKKAVLSSFKQNAKPPAGKGKIVKSALPNAVLLGAGLLPPIS